MSMTLSEKYHFLIRFKEINELRIKQQKKQTQITAQKTTQKTTQKLTKSTQKTTQKTTEKTIQKPIKSQNIVTKKKSLKERLGPKPKSITERLGKTVFERLGKALPKGTVVIGSGHVLGLKPKERIHKKYTAAISKRKLDKELNKYLEKDADLVRKQLDRELDFYLKE